VVDRVLPREQGEEERQDDEEVDRQAEGDCQHVLADLLEDVEAHLTHRAGKEGEDTDRQQADDGGSHLHHRLEAGGEPATEQVARLAAHDANRGAEAAQLINRYWLITDGDGNQQEVRGPGVVGNQPHLAPGDSFRYTSACVLETAVGVMQGHYEFRTDAGESFDAPIAAFSLEAHNAVH